MMNKVDIMSKKLDDLGTKYKGLNFIKNESSDSLFASKKLLHSTVKSPEASAAPVKVENNSKTQRSGGLTRHGGNGVKSNAQIVAMV